jgi:morphogenesis family protein
MRARPEAFKRLRTLTEALKLSAADRSGPVLRVLDTEHSRQVARAFASQGGSTGRAWAPWSPRYAAWRAKHKGRLGGKIMVLTGTLKEKATSPAHGGHVARWLGNLRYAFGFIDEHGYIHMNQEAPRGKMPLRSALIKTEADRRSFVAAFLRFYRARNRQVLRHA